MITRIEHESNGVQTVIPKHDYETDKSRGYCILEYYPESDRVVTNPRNPKQQTIVHMERTVIFRCMKCQFDAVAGDYREGNGLDKIKIHVSSSNHPWAYGAFQNPYGNVADVTIEGVEDYQKEIK